MRAIAVAAFQAAVGVAISAYVLFPLGMHLELPVRIARALSSTPLGSLTTELHYFVAIYVPDCVVMAILGFLAGRRTHRRRAMMAWLTFLSFIVGSRLTGNYGLAGAAGFALDGHWNVAVRIGVFAFITYATFLFGLWVGGRRRPRVRPGHCIRCAYNLTGLTEPRCPECGTPFGLAEHGSPN